MARRRVKKASLSHILTVPESGPKWYKESRAVQLVQGLSWSFLNDFNQLAGSKTGWLEFEVLTGRFSICESAHSALLGGAWQGV